MNKRITLKECEELYKENNTPQHVIAHCKAVSRVAVLIATELNKHGYSFDIPLIEGAGLAHDVARKCDDHGMVGAIILEKKSFMDEAKIVHDHMFHDFNDLEHLDETDMVCLGDRLVKEDEYVGVDERMNYIINKVHNNPERTKIILEKKKEMKKLVAQIEEKIGQSLDDLLMKG